MDQNDRRDQHIPRRRHPRYQVDTPLRAISSTNLKTDVTRSRTLDISEGGIAGIFHAGWKLDTPVTLEFTVPPEATLLRVRAVVRSRAGHRYGFEFSELTADQLLTLQNACSFLRRLA
jgi:c-di-GMP-binding flagellar brake protein YcgR